MKGLEQKLLSELGFEVFKNAHSDAMGKNQFGLVLIHLVGLGHNTVVVSFHDDYASYDTFRKHTRFNIDESILK